ncbi:MAG: cytosolic protein [Planctomycetes bacterium]|nr:cytosolic protein [Planctomycetota bacterium]
MNPKFQNKIACFVNGNIDTFHKNRLNKITGLKLTNILKRKNPYLFRAKNVITATDLVSSILDAYLSSSEEELFGEFLEELAIYVAEITSGGHKSAAEGIDLELTRDGVKYIVSIKSGPHWGNSGQYANLRQTFAAAKRILSQSKRMLPVQPVLGICYGKFRTVDNGKYIKIGGQNFWEFISSDPNFYIDIIEPLGYEAKKHNENYLREKANTYNRFAKDFLNEFCLPDGQIDWPKLIKFNSGNRKS